MIALAIDPGVTTGLCLAYLNENKLLVAPEEGKFTLSGLYNYLRWLRKHEGFVIYEDFQYRNASRAGLNLTPVKMIGVIELVAELGNAQVYKQTPAQGKGFYSDARLKELGIYKVGKAHGRDATRHLMQWLTFGAGAAEVNVNEVEMRLVEPGTIFELIQLVGDEK